MRLPKIWAFLFSVFAFLISFSAFGAADPNKVFQLTNQDGEKSINYIASSGLPLANQVTFFSGSGAPTNGGAGTGLNFAGPGSIYGRRDTGVLYINTNTAASPTWVSLASGASTVLSTPLTGFSAGAGTVSSADTVLTGFNKVVGNQAQLQNGQFTPTTETVTVAGALSTTIMESIVANAGGAGYAVTLAAPSSQDGQIKIIKMTTATNPVTLAMTNIVITGGFTGAGSTTLTFSAVGQSAIFMAVGTKWVYLGGSAAAT